MSDLSRKFLVSQFLGMKIEIFDKFSGEVRNPTWGGGLDDQRALNGPELSMHTTHQGRAEHWMPDVSMREFVLKWRVQFASNDNMRPKAFSHKIVMHRTTLSHNAVMHQTRAHQIS
eukprot:1182228-Prorocentrum_minimum.AAC.3